MFRIKTHHIFRFQNSTCKEIEVTQISSWLEERTQDSSDQFDSLEVPVPKWNPFKFRGHRRIGQDIDSRLRQSATLVDLQPLQWATELSCSGYQIVAVVSFHENECRQPVSFDDERLCEGRNRKAEIETDVSSDGRISSQLEELRADKSDRSVKRRKRQEGQDVEQNLFGQIENGPLRIFDLWNFRFGLLFDCCGLLFGEPGESCVFFDEFGLCFFELVDLVRVVAVVLTVESCLKWNLRIENIFSNFLRDLSEQMKIIKESY